MPKLDEILIADGLQSSQRVELRSKIQEQSKVTECQDPLIGGRAQEGLNESANSDSQKINPAHPDSPKISDFINHVSK